MAPGRFLLFSCEHGGYRIPAPYRALFQDQQALLRSHYGYDAGALRLAREMAAALDAPLQAATVSRLLIDLNRSPAHPRVYSTATRNLAPAQRREIFEQYYLPYRSAVQRRIAAAIDAGQRVLHVSCHSFTPALDGKLRDADLGLLYDPARAEEATLCRRWQASLRAGLPGLNIRRNAPYKGSADGLHLVPAAPALTAPAMPASSLKSTSATCCAAKPDGRQCGARSSKACAQRSRPASGIARLPARWRPDAGTARLSL